MMRYPSRLTASSAFQKRPAARASSRLLALLISGADRSIRGCIEQGVQRLFAFQYLPHVPNRCFRIGAVKANCRHLLLDDPVPDVRAVDAGIAFEFMKQQINFIRKNCAEIVDILIPAAIKS